MKNDPNYNKYGFGNYFMIQIRTLLQNLISDKKTIAVCVAAKPNKHHYDQNFIDMGFNVNDFTFLGREDSANWNSYDAVLLLGGETKALHSWMLKNNFNIRDMVNCELIAGDSAGAYVLASKTLVDYTADGSHFEIIDGFMPEIKILFAAHANNPYYYKESLGVALEKWCGENDVQYVSIEENQIRETTLQA